MSVTCSKFRVRLIPVTLLWSVAFCQLLVAVFQVGYCFAELIQLKPTSGLEESWSPLFGLAFIAWLLPSGRAAWVAGRLFYKGRWKAATIALGALIVVAYLGLIPLLVVLANYPGAL
jgi:hypothetical protein